MLIVSLSTFGLFRLVARNIMPPKTSLVEQSGFIAKQEDFPALSPVGASGSSGVLLQERTSRLESSQADLARSVAALHEGQQELAHQIGELIRGFSAPTTSSSRVSSVPPAAQVVTDQTQFTHQAAHLRQPVPAAPQRQLSYVDFRRYIDTIDPGFETSHPPPSAPFRPHIFAIENDPTYRQLSVSKFKGALEEYQLLVCHGFFLSCAVAAQVEAIEALRADGHEVFAEQFEAILNTLASSEDAIRQRMHYVRLAKGQAKLSQSDQLFAENLRSAFQPSPVHYGHPSTAGLYERFRAKEIECSLTAAAKAAAGKKYSSSSASASTVEGSKTKSKNQTKGKGKYNQEKPKESDNDS